MGKEKIKDLVEFPSPDALRMFKVCLTKTPALCKIYTDDDGNKVIAMRPKSFPTFRFILENHGLGKCPVANGVLRLIENDFSEFLRFTHYTNQNG